MFEGISVDNSTSTSKRTGILQFDSSSLLSNTNKIRLIIEEWKPDIVLIQETNLKNNHVIKFNRQSITRRDRTILRNKNKKLRERRVVILVKNTDNNL